jgi:DNA-binding MarR family transcriptional regulator
MLSTEVARPPRTAAGDAFTELVLDVAGLGVLFTAAGESLAAVGDQTLARWVILDFVEDRPSTVAEIARRRGIARQAVQRVADVLEREGLVAYQVNPNHRRSKLLQPTVRGRKVLRVISVQQKEWADAVGAEIGEARLRTLSRTIGRIRRAVIARGLPGIGARDGETPSWRPPSE